MWGDDNVSGGQGQGFITSPGFGSPSGQNQEKKKTRANNILPVTVSEIFSAQIMDGKFFTMNGNTEMNQVSVVGVVKSVKESSARIEYEIDDKTGPLLEVKMFVSNDEDAAEEERIEPVRENTYVKIFGHLRTFQSKRSMAAFKIVPLTDMNQLTAHLLDILYSHIWYSVSQDAKPSESTSKPSYKVEGHYDDGMGSANGLTNIQKQVHSLIQCCPSEQGASVVDIKGQLHGVNERQIREAIDFLSNEGHIYSTIDDDHYKTTDS